MCLRVCVCVCLLLLLLLLLLMSHHVVAAIVQLNIIFENWDGDTSKYSLSRYTALYDVDILHKSTEVKLQLVNINFTITRLLRLS